MDPTHRCEVSRPCFPPHHHHHHHHTHCRYHSLCLCPHRHCYHQKHHHHHQHHQFNGHSHVCPNFAASFPRNPEPCGPAHFRSNPSIGVSGWEEAYDFATPMLQEQEQEHVGFEDDEEDDPVFILTDEWREFFAKSEEKRKLGTSYFLSAFRLPEM
ncbi:hypothetical protein CJ030_MR1G002454 [Morella rubra]|uniref:Uncharacterized protein n=1 Tax=Morella rubra TaxID=262757 RepID=A0A6A1WJQ5_9ROSI|nr:hypothetical protein CJ030_MR1G002454 [Morella rubra]